MRYGASPFEGIDKVQIGGAPKDPFLRCKNIKRDLALPADRNIVSCDPVNYVLRIDGMEWFDSTNPAKATKSYVKTKFGILWTDGDMAVEMESANVGLVRSPAVYLLDVTGQYFKADMARLVCNIVNMHPAQVGKAHYEAAIGPMQPLTGKCVMCRVENIKTKKGQGTDFTRHWFTPIGVNLKPDGTLMRNPDGSPQIWPVQSNVIPIADH